MFCYSSIPWRLTMEILLYFVAYFIIAILNAILLRLCDFPEDLSIILGLLWFISIPVVICTGIFHRLIYKPIQFIIRKFI